MEGEKRIEKQEQKRKREDQKRIEEERKSTRMVDQHVKSVFLCEDLGERSRLTSVWTLKFHCSFVLTCLVSTVKSS